jgi:hypothetical protein
LNYLAARADLDDRLALRDDEHRIASIVGANHWHAGSKGARVERLGNLGDLAVVHRGEQRHAGNHAQGHHKLVAARFLVEARGDNGDWQRHHADAAQHHHAPPALSPKTLFGTTSPYPTVVSVESAHQAVSGMESNLSG